MNEPDPPLQFSDHGSRRANTRRAGGIVAGGSVSLLAFYLVVFAAPNPWQFQLLSLLVLLVGISGLTAVLLARRGRPELGMGQLIAVLGAGYLLTALLVQELSVFLMVCALSNTVILGVLGLPQKCLARVVGSGVLLSLGILAVTIWGPGEQISLPLVVHIAFPLLVTILFALLSIPVFRRYSLRTLPGQNLAGLLGTVVIVVLVLGGILVVNTIRATNQYNDTLLLDLNRDRAAALQNALRTPLDDIQLLSAELFLHGYLADQGELGELTADELLNSQAAEFTALAEMRGIYSQIQVLDRQGQEVLRLVRTAGGGFETTPAGRLQDLAQVDYYRYAVLLPAGRTYISRLELDSPWSDSDGPPIPVLRYAAPVYSGGSAVGLVVLHVAAEDFLNLLRPEQFNAFLVDSEGSYLYHSQPGKRFGLLNGSGESVRRDYPQLLDRLYASQENLAIHQGSLYAFLPVTIPGEIHPRWFLSSYLPLTEALLPVASALAGVLALLLGVLLVAVPVAVFAAGRISAPLQRITRAAELMAAGDLGVRAPAHSTVEISTLALALNGLAGSLQALVHDLEARVAQRTAQLESTNQDLLHEIVERQQVEADLRDSESRFRRIFADGPLGMALVDLDFRFTAVNATLCRMLGYSEAELLALTFVDFTHPDDLELDLGFIHQLRAGEIDKYTIEKRYLRRDGSLLWVSLTGTLVQDGGGIPLYFLGMVEDISDRKRAEDSILQANLLLAEQVTQLEAYNDEISHLNELGEALQACEDESAFYELVARRLPGLFPQESGALFQPQDELLVFACGWGLDSPALEGFAAEGCVAVQQEQLLCTPAGRRESLCRCTPQTDVGGHVCAPLISGRELLGLLVLHAGRGRLDEPTVRRREKLVRMVVEQLSLALANLKLREHLRQQAIRDPLTGLYNRRHMEDFLQRELHRAGRSEYPVSLIMIDLDHFKHINDAYGHQPGDEVLRALGALLKGGIRGGDIACRYGGEEFLIILPEAPQEVARRRADQIRFQISQLQVDCQGQTISGLTASLGVATFPQHGLEVGELIQRADRALYKAKRRSRNCVVVYDSPHQRTRSPARTPTR